MSSTRILSSLLTDPGTPCSKLLERSRQLGALQSRLESIIGSASANHYHIQNVREGTLILQTDAPHWAARLRFELPRILEQLRGTPGFQQLRDIQVRVAHPVNHRAKAPRHARLSKQAASILENAADAMPDADLRAAFKRLARKGTG